MLLRTLQEVTVLGMRSAWSDDEDQIWPYSACRRDAPCGMRRILEPARVYDDDYDYGDHGLERCLLCVEPDDETGCCLLHFLRHVGAGFRQPLQSFVRAELHCHCAGWRVSLRRYRERHLSLHHRIGRRFDDWEWRRGDFVRHSRGHRGDRLVADRCIQPQHHWKRAAGCDSD